jgi:hypothetical protein
MDVVERTWAQAHYAARPDFGFSAPSFREEADEDGMWPERWSTAVPAGDVDPDREGVVDRDRGVMLDWSPRAGSSVALAVFFKTMGFNSTRRIVQQARRVCRKMAMLGKAKALDRLCPAEGNGVDGSGLQAWA